MATVKVYFGRIEVTLKTGPDIGNVSSDLAQLVRQSGIENGTLNANMVGSTGSLSAIEYEPGVIEDLKEAVSRLAPPGRVYRHELAWHDGNGHSHVQAALLGPSISLAVRKGRMATGTWQQVVAINHDNRPRTRTIEVTIVGS